MSEARWGVVANHLGDKVFRQGARVWVALTSYDRTMSVRGLSIGGRTVTKWVRAYRLTNFRARFVPPGADFGYFVDKESAEAYARNCNAASVALSGPLDIPSSWMAR